MASIGPISLDPGNVVRILRGQGTRVIAARGALWVTEEGSLADHVLQPGDTVTLQRPGKALVLALHPGRAFIETPQGVAPPDAVELASADGRPGRRIRDNAGAVAKRLAWFGRAALEWIGWPIEGRPAQQSFTRSPLRRA